MLTHVDRFLHFLEDEQDRSANTTAAYRNDLTQFTRFVKERAAAEQMSDEMGDDRPAAQPCAAIASWREVDDGLMQTYLAHLKQSDYASATVARKVASVKSFFHWMEEDGSLGRNPADALETPRVKKVAPRPISPEEIERLLAEPGRDSTPQALRDRALMETLYASGMRVSEVVALDLDDVDLEQAQIHGERSKRGRIPSSASRPALQLSALRALADYLADGRPHLLGAPDERALFLNHRGQRLTRQGLWLIIKRYTRQVGIQASVTPHSLRQSFAAHQLNAGGRGPQIIIDGKPYTGA